MRLALTFQRNGAILGLFILFQNKLYKIDFIEKYYFGSDQNVGTEAVQIKIAKIPLFETDSQIKQIIIKLLKCRPNLRHEFVAE